MKNLFLTIILSSTCFMMYGQVKGPDKGVKVTNTPTSTESSSVIYKGKEKAVNVMPSKPKPVVSPVGRAVKPGSQGEKVKPTGNSKPSGASSAAPERGQRPQSQMDAERPTASPERGQRPQSQMDAERPTASPERGQRPQSQMDAERPTASPERGQRPQSQMDAERPTASPERGQRPQSQMDAERPTASPERGQRPQSQMDAERPTASPERGKAPQSQMEKEVPSKVSSKTSAVKTPVGGEGDDAFCNGWRDGYIKEWNAKSNEFVTPKVPPCEENANLEGDKNGYKAGMKRAQLDKK